MTSYFIPKSMKNKLYNNVVNDVFPSLEYEDKNILTNYLFELIDIIAIKFNFDEKQKDKYLYQFEQNNYKDSKGLLLALLPFIKDNDETAKKNLKQLSDLYVKKEEQSSKVNLLKGEPKYKYTNIQYNRCKRVEEDNDENIEIPFSHEHLKHNFKLMKESIKTMRNRLYVNWLNILPVSIKNYKETDMFKVTVKQFKEKNLIYWNPYQNSDSEEYKKGLQNIGLDVSEVYDTIVNHLYYSIKNIKWTLFSVGSGENVIPTIQVLYDILKLEKCFMGYTWTQLNDNERYEFESRWKQFCQAFINHENFEILDNKLTETLMIQLIYSFEKSNQVFPLINGSNYKYMLSKDELKEKYGSRYEKELFQITIDRVRDTLQNESNYIYNFFEESFSKFRKTWYGYYMFNNNMKFNDRIKFDDGDFIVLKNVYNYAKSMSKDTVKGEFTNQPRFWKSFSDTEKERIKIERINSGTNGSWFDINRYLKEFFPKKKTYQVHDRIREKLPEIIFEALILNGVLSEFVPDKEITDDRLLPSNPLEKKKTVKNTLHNRYKNNQKFKNRIDNSYYFIENKRFGDMEMTYKKNNKKKAINYVKWMFKNSNWMFTYAMDWISQIIFFHHYLNNRVIFVTGATGVGKSSQIPKLFMYAVKMIDYKLNGKVICTQPRKPPTVQNALYMSSDVGFPIEEYNEDVDAKVVTPNYNIQYKHQEKKHVYDNQIGVTLKFVTDGTLMSDLYLNPLLKKSIISGRKKDKSAENRIFISNNLYDVVIIDEAHEHNVNMDMILTLMKYSTYFNNNIRLAIVSATLDSDEPRYRRYYRDINDNKIFPLNNYLPKYKIDRINVDRRIHISEPGKTTQYKIDDVPVPGTGNLKEAVEMTIDIVKTTLDGDILLFMPGEAEIKSAVDELIANTPDNVLILPYFGKLSDTNRAMVENIDKGLSRYPYEKTLYIGGYFDPKQVKKVPQNTYQRAVIVATNIAEASITIDSLKYVVDTGVEKVNRYNFSQNSSVLRPEFISDSSRIQRRGRVGRTKDGTVYYMYDIKETKGKDIKFKITLENIKETLLKYLVKSKQIGDDEKGSEPFFNIENDPNLSDGLQKIDYMSGIDKIIEEQYFVKGEFFYYKGNKKHYDYQKNNIPWLYYKTGMMSNSLMDKDGNFYLVHPDENLLIRNIYGDIVDVKPRKDEYLFSNKKYESFKIKYFFEVLQMYDVVQKFGIDNVDKKHQINTDYNDLLQEEYYYKTILGQRINDIQVSIQSEVITFESIIVYLYSRLYNCGDHVIKFLAMISTFDSPKAMFSDKLPEMISCFKNQYGDSYGYIVVANMILHLFENKLGYQTCSTSVSDTKLENDISKFKSKFFTAFENNNFGEFKGNKKLNDYFELFYTNKLHNSVEVKPSEMKDSLKNKHVVSHNISNLDDPSVRNYVEQWLSKYGLNFDKVIKFYKIYLDLSQTICNLEKKIYNEESPVEVYLEWFDDNLKKKDKIIGSTLIENITICIMYGYFYNISTILFIKNDNYYHVNVFNPNIETIYQVKKFFKKSLPGRENLNDTFLDSQYLSDIVFIKSKPGNDTTEINIIDHIPEALITKIFNSLKLDNLSKNFSNVYDIDVQRTRIKDLIGSYQEDSQLVNNMTYPKFISTVIPKYIDALHHIRSLVEKNN